MPINEPKGYIPPGAENWNVSEKDPNMSEAAPNEEDKTNQIQQELSAHGYLLDSATPPYKSFGPNERFYIAKSFDSLNQETVVKIAADETAYETLKREGHLYDVLQQAIVETQANGIAVGINFPKKMNQFELGQQDHRLVIVTNFVQDNKQIKAAMSTEQKIALIAYTVQEMNKLTVPQDEIQKNWQERTIKVETAEEVNWHGKRIVTELSDPAVAMLSPADGEKLAQYIDRLTPVLKNYPLRFDHSDLHGGNISYSIDAESGQPNITLMDLEGLKISNEFSSIAQLMNREALRNELTKFETELAKTPKYKEQVEEAMAFIPEGITPVLEKTFVKNESDRQVLQLMRFFETLTVLSNTIHPNDLAEEMKRTLYTGLLHEQLEQLRQEKVFE